jgi:hypothetical protein
MPGHLPDLFRVESADGITQAEGPLHQVLIEQYPVGLEYTIVEVTCSLLVAA